MAVIAGLGVAKKQTQVWKYMAAHTDKWGLGCKNRSGLYQLAIFCLLQTGLQMQA